MTAAKEAKKAGLSSLIEASEISKTSTQTLNNWYRENRARFEAVIKGCVVIKSEARQRRLIKREIGE